jgi:hypothetical protein
MSYEYAVQRHNLTKMARNVREILRRTLQISSMKAQVAVFGDS